MAISNELILEWIDRLAQCEGVQMDPDSLADDVFLMAYVFQHEPDFVEAMHNVSRAIRQVAALQVEPSQLERASSYHFQSQRIQRRRADLRIVFQPSINGGLRIRGFGHRHLPSDIYKRLDPRTN